ncbi:MAG: polyphenol oxidase family protein [Treponema sp.]|jgi:YfiH family protein|nr:polyphenol oxidase family protein [Treponema sp.]
MDISFFNLDFTPNPQFARFPFIYDGREVPGVSCGISSRSAGSMANLNLVRPEAAPCIEHETAFHAYSGEKPNSHRERLFRSLGLDPALVYACAQVHSRTVVEVDRLSPRNGPEADGMTGADAGLTLSVTVADCLPVFLFDTRTGASGLVHSGWKGTGIVLEALGLMQARRHTRPEEVAAVLGPCIQGCCYRVDEERARSFEAEFGGSDGGFPLGPVIRERADLPGGPGFSLNLQAANARLLANAGVRNIAVCRDCTFTDERLGSFRREGAQSYTRMVALLGASQTCGFLHQN